AVPRVVPAERQRAGRVSGSVEEGGAGAEGRAHSGGRRLNSRISCANAGSHTPTRPCLLSPGSGVERAKDGERPFALAAEILRDAIRAHAPVQLRPAPADEPGGARL